MPVPVNDSLREPGTTPIDVLRDVGTDSPQELGGADSPKEAVEPLQGIVVPLRDIGATELPRNEGVTEPPRRAGVKERDVDTVDPL